MIFTTDQRGRDPIMKVRVRWLFSKIPWPNGGALEQPEEFWAEAAEANDWERRWDQVLDTSRPPFYRWFRARRSIHAGMPSIAISRLDEETTSP